MRDRNTMGVGLEVGISDSSDDEESNAEIKSTSNNTNKKGGNVKTPASRNKEKKGAKFSDDTKGTSNGRTTKKRTKRSWGGKPKAYHQYKTYYNFELTIRSTEDTQAAVMKKFGDMIAKMQERDGDVAII